MALRAVGAAVRQDGDLEVARVLLREHGREGAPDPAGLVEGGDADGERLGAGNADRAGHLSLQSR